MDGSFAIEEHPWQPFLPQGCRLLMLGSFPPARKRWCMDFFYPNYINDMWRIFGIVFFGDKQHFVDEERKQFRMDDIIRFLTERGIGLYDTAVAVRRLKNTASDKDLEVVTSTDLDALLCQIPQCEAVVTTGQKATDIRNRSSCRRELVWILFWQSSATTLSYAEQFPCLSDESGKESRHLSTNV